MNEIIQIFVYNILLDIKFKDSTSAEEIDHDTID